MTDIHIIPFKDHPDYQSYLNSIDLARFSDWPAYLEAKRTSSLSAYLGFSITTLHNLYFESYSQIADQIIKLFNNKLYDKSTGEVITEKVYLIEELMGTLMTKRQFFHRLRHFKISPEVLQHIIDTLTLEYATH